MKKICYFINSDWYFDLHWIDRARQAKESGYEVVILVTFRDASLMSKLTAEGFECIDSGMHEQSINPFRFFYDSMSCIRKLIKIKPDLLVAITIKCLVIGGIYARLKKTPIVLNFVGLGRVFNSNTPINGLLKQLIKPCIKWISGFHKSYFCFEHEFDKVKLLTEVGIHTDRAVVINGAGVDCEKYVMLPEPDTEEVTILYASRLINKKGLPDLVNIIKELQAELKHPIKLRVAGIYVPDDPDAIPEYVIKEWKKNHLIEWLGKSDNIPQLLATSHIVALPSVYPEGIPRILLESFAAGRPSIAYSIDGCKSLITNNYDGILVDIGDLAQFKTRLCELIRDKELRSSLGNAARNTAIHKYSLDIINNETIILYNKVVNGEGYNGRE